MLQPFIANFNANGDGEPLLYYQAQLGGGRGISGGGSHSFLSAPWANGPHGMFSYRRRLRCAATSTRGSNPSKPSIPA